MVDCTQKLDVYVAMQKALFNEVLWAHELQHSSFIWFFLCYIRADVLNSFLTSLWRITITPAFSPNEWKRAHNAVALMAGLLARGNFVSLS